jgi:hypothetical protein
LVYPQTTITATTGQAISANTPTVTGTVTAYSVAPALPAGLSLNTTTGAISGSPTGAAVQASYTITASNSSGSTTATVQITVNAAVVPPTNLVYPQTSITATVGQATLHFLLIFSYLRFRFGYDPPAPPFFLRENSRMIWEVEKPVLSTI